MNTHFSRSDSTRKTISLFIFASIAIILLWLSLSLMKGALIIVAGACVICFLTEPVVQLYERRMKRNRAALFALLSCFLLLGAVLFALLPTAISEGSQLLHTLPQSAAMIRSRITDASEWLNQQFPGIRFPSMSIADKTLPALANGTIRFAGSVADLFYHFFLMTVLSYFFLCDKDKLLILLELLIPRALRKTAVLMGHSVCRELRIYLRSQGVIAAAVGILTAIGLIIAGLDSAIILGFIVGVLNMIPYFGPIIGAVPAVMAAINNSFQAVLITIAVLWLVQQIDGNFISPRIMSSQTGISPAIVLLAVFVGSRLGGIAGMLFALPIVITIRTLFRVFVQRYENV